MIVYHVSLSWKRISCLSIEPLIHKRGSYTIYAVFYEEEKKL